MPLPTNTKMYTYTNSSGCVIFPIMGLPCFTLTAISHDTENISRDRHVALFQCIQMFLRQKLLKPLTYYRKLQSS
jgi:hypothetical protein